jgi:dipeptidyl aminopeptidase/acylaminoacyl peptidase
LLGCFAQACKTGQIAAASTVTYVSRKSPPMLLIVGDNDGLVPHQQTLEMAAKLKAAGVPHELIVMHGIDHSLLGKTLDRTRQANLRALDATFHFIDETIGGRHSSR